MTDANKLTETDVERVDAVDKPATALKFVIRKYAAEPVEKTSFQVGDALPDNDYEGDKDAQDGELQDGSDLVQKIAKAVAAELAPGLDKIAEAVEKSGAMRIEKSAARPTSKQNTEAPKTEVKKRGEGLFTDVIFGKN